MITFGGADNVYFTGYMDFFPILFLCPSGAILFPGQEKVCTLKIGEDIFKELDEMVEYLRFFVVLKSEKRQARICMLTTK